MTFQTAFDVRHGINDTWLSLQLTFLRDNASLPTASWQYPLNAVPRSQVAEKIHSRLASWSADDAVDCDAAVRELRELEEKIAFVDESKRLTDLSPRRQMTDVAKGLGISKATLLNRLHDLNLGPDDLRDPRLSALELLKKSTLWREISQVLSV